MLDAPLRRVASPVLDRAGRRLAGARIRPLWLTGSGFALGVAACGAVATRHFAVALGLWLANRLLDALDGAVARALGPTERGAFFDIVADFAIYGGFVAALAVALPGARLACVALLTAYYVSGTAFLALSSLLERRRAATGDGRSLHFVGGLAEGVETVVVYGLFCLVPGEAEPIAWAFTAAVAITAVQRVVAGGRLLTRQPRAGGLSAPAAGGVAPSDAALSAAGAVPGNGWSAR